MFIDYNKIKELFIKLSRELQDNNIDSMIDTISNFSDLDILLECTEIIKQKKELDYLYELKVAEYHIGYMKSDLEYDINSDKNKIRFINYLLKYYEESRVLFLRAILDLNIKVLKDNIDSDITFKTDVKPKNAEKEYLSDDMYVVDSYIYHSIYSKEIFIGMDMIENYGYKSETDFTKEEDVFAKGRFPLSKNTKLLFATTMKRYNDAYFNKYLKKEDNKIVK